MSLVSEKLKDLRHFGHEGGLCNVVLSHPNLYLECLDVEPSHFAQPLYRLIWGKIVAANNNRAGTAPAPNIASILHESDPDLVKIADDEYGGYPQLYRDFITLKCRPEHLAMFRDRVLAMAYQRMMVVQIQILSEEITRLADARDPKLEVMQRKLEEKTTELLRATSGRDRSGGLMMELEPDEWIAAQRLLVDEQGEVQGFETGMFAFDSLELLQPGRVTLSIIEYKGGKSTWGVTFAARLGIGKRLANYLDRASGSGYQVGEELIFEDAYGEPIKTRKVAYIDLEMGKDRDVLPRIQSFVSGVPVNMIRSRRFLREEFDVERVRKACALIRESGMKFWHKLNFSMPWLRNVVRETVYRDSTEVVVIDYIKKPSGMGKEEGLEWEASMAQEVKNLAEEFNIHIITFAQFNRDGQASKRAFKGQRRPTSAEIQGSIKIINFVDTVLIQDKDPDDPNCRRLWVDVSRICEQSTDNYLVVKPNFSLSQMEIVGWDTLKDDVEEVKPKREAKPRTKAAPQAPEPYALQTEMLLSYESATGYEDIPTAPFYYGPSAEHVGHEVMDDDLDVEVVDMV